ncbi:MAG: DUF5961 family protein [Caulobacteraceae bacterium]
MTAAAETHRFYVHASDAARGAGRVIEDAGSAEEAAFIFAEHGLAQADGEDVALIVRDCDTGAQHCFRIDLATGESAPCD